MPFRLDQKENFRIRNEKRGDGQMMDVLIIIVLCFLGTGIGFTALVLNEVVRDISEIRYILELEARTKK